MICVADAGRSHKMACAHLLHIERNAGCGINFIRQEFTMFESSLPRWRGFRSTIVQALCVLVLVLTAQTFAQPGALMHANTLSNNRKSNQSKSWYHDGKWWAIAPDVTKNADYIWRYDGGGVWTRMSNKLEKGSLNHYDVFMDSQTGELAVVRSHTKYTKFYRYLYNSGSWSLQLSTVLYNFGNPDNNNPCSLTKAKNGEFWVFQVLDSTVQARYSSDGGATWAPKFRLSSKKLKSERGTTAAVSFSRFGNNLLGVAYGEIGATGVNTQYGFFFHRETDPYNVWVDETANLPLLGNEKGNNQLSLATDKQGYVYMFTRNFGGNAASPRNTLYKRTANKTWQAFAVNLNGDNHKWNAPVVAVDTTDQVLIVAGIRLDSSFAEYKCVPLGQEASLLNAPRAVLMQNGADVLEDLNFPRQQVNSLSGLLSTAGNATQNKTWFYVFFKNPVVPIQVHAVDVDTNEVNAKGRYTIPITLTDLQDGTLTAGLSTISIRFTASVNVPASINPSHVTVNGVAAASVSTTPLVKEVMITPANTIAGNASVTIIIDSLACILNKQKPGWDSLQVWTSAQPIPVYSPPFSLIMATTKVRAALVRPEPTLPNSPAAYTIGFRLGRHGRMVGGQDTLRIGFDAQTKVAHGTLNGVLVNSTSANATGDSASKKVVINLPASLQLANEDTVTVQLTANMLTNPALTGLHTLLVSTSVETCQVASLPYEIGAVDTCGTPIPGTNGTFARNNQSKTFYHGGTWWLIAQAQADNDWYLWKFDGIGWTQGLKISEYSKDRPDVWLESSKNKAYVLLPGTTTTKFLLLQYSGSAWSLDSDYPTTVNLVQNDEMHLVRAKDGDFWVFWTADSTVWAQRSDDEGETWFPAVRIRKLHVLTALTDAVQTKIGGSNSIGVGYAENSSSSSARYGFLYHKDGDADSVWTDETDSKLAPIQPAGTSADNHINMATHNNEVFMIVKTKGGSGAVTKNALFHRNSGGTWSRYDIILGNGWTRPVVTLDVTNNVLYAFGIREGATKVIEMKRVGLGNYGSLLAAPIDTVICNHPDNFFDISLPMHTVTSASNLLLVAENDTKNQLWFKQLLLAPLAKTAEDKEEETISAPLIDDYKLQASVYPNPFNPRTAIQFTLPQSARVKLQIFNLSGQLLRTLVNEELPAGAHQRRWNARDESGRRVASGTYLYRLQVGPNVLTGNMQLLK